MTQYRLNRALTEIDDRYLIMVDRKIEEVRTMRKKANHSSVFFRTVLIAAIITALLGITAYGVSSIHQARQQKLRTDLQIEENHVSGYTEYADETENRPEAESETSAEEGRPRIQLISSMQQGDFQMIYLSVSPVAEELAHSFIFDNMETEFVYIASNEEIPESAWATAGELDRPYEKSFAHPVPYTEGHEAEHMIEMSSDTGLPDENGKQQTVTFEVVDPAWFKPLLLEHSYDPETRSLMLMCAVYRTTVDFSRPVFFSVRCLDGRSVWCDPDTPTEEYIANYSPIYLMDYGMVTLEAADTSFVTANLPASVRLTNPENNGSLEILNIRLSANCVEWKMTHDDIDLIHNPDPESPTFHEDFEKQLQWIRFQDEILSSAYLRFEDGRMFPLNASASAPYENGTVTLTSVWDSTIDIGTVRSITVMGTEYDFPQVGSIQ